MCGAWSYQRDYFVWLPAGYDGTKAYPLVFQGPGCGAGGANVVPLGDAGAQVIRVGLTPPPNDIQRVVYPGQGCFDDDDGDSSVDWVFYEHLYDRLAAQLCFDRNRVFASGNQGGGRFADALGCKYAGDAARPIRGVLVDGGGLPAEALYAPTCTTKPMAGFWVVKTATGAEPLAASKRAISRAMTVNGCTAAPTYDDATFEDFPIANGPQVSGSRAARRHTLWWSARWRGATSPARRTSRPRPSPRSSPCSRPSVSRAGAERGMSRARRPIAGLVFPARRPFACGTVRRETGTASSASEGDPETRQVTRGRDR